MRKHTSRPLTPEQMLKDRRGRAKVLTLRKRATKARAKVKGTLLRSRFSTMVGGEEFVGYGSNRSGSIKYSIHEVERAIAMMATATPMEVARKTGFSPQMLKTWKLRNVPLDGPRYVGAKNVRQIVLKARSRSQRTGEPPSRTLRLEWVAAGLPYSSLKVHISMERIPLPADFIVYGDPAVQMRCVKMWHAVPGKSEAKPVVRPVVPAQAGLSHARPACPPAPLALGSVLQGRRRKDGYGFQVGRSIPRR